MSAIRAPFVMRLISSLDLMSRIVMAGLLTSTNETWGKFSLRRLYSSKEIWSISMAIREAEGMSFLSVR